MRVYELLEKTEIKSSFIGFIHVGDSHKPDERYVGEISQLDEAINLYSIDELIFCSKTLSAQEIISHMSVIDRHNLDFKIAPEESMYVIGSNSINTQGELYAFEVNGINKPENIRNKRVFDIISSLLCDFIPDFSNYIQSFLGLLKNIY